MGRETLKCRCDIIVILASREQIIVYWYMMMCDIFLP
jgi:hypothetical protein